MGLVTKHWKDIALIAGIVFTMMYFFKPKIKEVKIPIRIEVPVPVIENDFDTVKDPIPIPPKKDKNNKPIIQIDSTYYDKYIKLKDSVERDSMFKKAIEINTYKEKVEDDSITINLTMKVRGKLLEYQAGYKTKPRTILLDTTVTVPIPKYNEFYGGFSLGLPLTKQPLDGVTPIFKIDSYLKTKNDNIWSLSFDSRNYIFIGHAWKF